MVEPQTEKKIKHLITDNGGEFCNGQFLKLCQDEGIIRHFTVKDIPPERMNRTLLEKVQCMLSNARLGKEFWAEAMTYACHLINCLLSTAIDDRIPFEVWFGQPVFYYDSLHVFCSTAY